MSVGDFYDGQTILVTGCSGFLGKVLLEKILRSIPNVGAIYCVIRSSRGRDAQERLELILENELFDSVRESNPECLKKCVAISGNLSEANLGICERDEETIVDQVSTFFHCAATVKFDEALKQAIKLNVTGTKMMLRLAQRCRNLRSFVHVSSTYANSDRNTVEEKVYTGSIPADSIINFAEWIPDSACSMLTPYIVGKKPNTYTFTKFIAEEVVTSDEFNAIPTIIVRPSIIGAVWNEPIPGWTENLNGANGIFTATGAGILRGMLCGAANTVDIIPVDVVANSIIVAGWVIGSGNEKFDQCPVVNCCSGMLNPVKLQQVADYVLSAFDRYPIKERIRDPKFIIHQNWYKFRSMVILQQRLPAFVVDTVSSLGVTGKRTSLIKQNRKVDAAVNTLTYFVDNNFKFVSDRLKQMHSQLSAEDKQSFGMDISSLNWSAYLETYCLGLKRHVLKEPSEKMVPVVNQKGKKRSLPIQLVMRYVAFIYGLQFVMKRSKTARNCLLLWWSLLKKILIISSNFSNQLHS